MKRIIAASLVMAGVVSGVSEPPLPAWDSEERTRMLEEGWIAGGSLLSFETETGEDTAEDRIRDQVAVNPDELATEENTENDVSEEYLIEYFAGRPSGHLVDPQELLGSLARKDVEAFLAGHSSESSIDLFVYVFGGDQEIPGDVREEEVVERLYSEGKPAVVIYYYLGAPQRTALYLSPVITEEVSAAEQRRALQSSVIRALGDSEPTEQIQSFLTQMSIRIYWMERIAQGTAVETKGVIEGEEAVAEVVEPTEPEVEVDQPIPGWVKMLTGGVVSVLGLVLFFWSGLMWLRQRARYVFPEFDVEPRLGANHAAGIGAVISFASSSVPPASQRDQVPHYMRRA